MRRYGQTMRMAMLVVAALAVGGCGASVPVHSSSASSTSQTSASAATSPAATAATTTASSTASAPSGSPRIIDGSFYSPAVRGTLHYQIALPPGSATDGKRYPVLYVLHGLPASAPAYKSVAGYADRLGRHS